MKFLSSKAFLCTRVIYSVVLEGKWKYVRNWDVDFLFNLGRVTSKTNT